MANLFELPRYIAVEGPIRVGKSTLAGILAERLNAQRVTERIVARDEHCDRADRDQHHAGPEVLGVGQFHGLNQTLT